ncbi:MAG: hypothetical protein P8X95_28340 [Anaerolineales bacterium]
MNRINLLAIEHPLAFGLLVTIVFILMTILSSVLGAIWPGEPYGHFTGSTIGRVISIVILLMALARLGWLRPAGFTRLGRPQAWLIGLVLLAYWVPVSAYAVTGNFDFSISNPVLLSVLILLPFGD